MSNEKAINRTNLLNKINEQLNYLEEEDLIILNDKLETEFKNKSGESIN